MNLTPAQAERLAVLLEELGEAQQAIGKILRHGYDSRNPYKPDSPDNRANLEREIGDVLFAIRMMLCKNDLNFEKISDHETMKGESIWRFLHYQDHLPMMTTT